MPIDSFGWQNKEKGYRDSWCYPCKLEYQREYKRADPEKWKPYFREYAKKARKQNPSRFIAMELRQRCKKYGVTVAWLIAQTEKQNGVCALCLKPEVSRRRKDSTLRSLAIDHCHVDGTARGLLCSACNQAVGKIESAPGWLERAAEYLKET